jgi:transposase
MYKKKIPNWRELRRLRAIKLLRKKWKQVKIAEILDVTQTAVSQWLHLYNKGGPTSLLEKAPHGARCKLSDEQKLQLQNFLLYGAEAYGFQGDLWTSARIGKIIEKEFGVHYHRNHVAKILKEIKFTSHLPIVRALQRNEEEIKRWRVETWPLLKNRAKKERKTIFLLDETGFYLLPSFAKSYWLRGENMELKTKLTHDHLSSIGGITPNGEIAVWTQHEIINEKIVVEFLSHLLMRFNDRLLVIWDGSPIHMKSFFVRSFVFAIGEDNLSIEQFPGYAPDLNPTEGLWHQLKDVELKNICNSNLEDLHIKLNLAIGKIRHNPQLIQSFFGQSKLDISEFKI